MASRERTHREGERRWGPATQEMAAPKIEVVRCWVAGPPPGLSHAMCRQTELQRPAMARTTESCIANTSRVVPSYVPVQSCLSLGTSTSRAITRTRSAARWMLPSSTVCDPKLLPDHA